MTIPLVSFTDYIIFGNSIYWNTWLGASLIIFGFGLLVYSTFKEQNENYSNDLVMNIDHVNSNDIKHRSLEIDE